MRTCWVDAGRIEGLLPSDRAALLRVFRTTLRTNVGEGSVPSLAATIWDRLLAGSDPLTVADGRAYVDRLFRVGRLQEARHSWLALTRINGVADTTFEQGSSQVWNANFELEPLGAPLGWRISRSEAFEAERETGEGSDGSGALEIEFLGTENVNFAHVSQELILESEVTYRLVTRMRSEELSTDRGVFIELFSRDPNDLVISSGPILGTTDWISFESEFTMPAGDGRAMIRLRRLPSRQIDNRLRGKVLVDSVRIEQVNP